MLAPCASRASYLSCAGDRWGVVVELLDASAPPVAAALCAERLFGSRSRSLPPCSWPVPGGRMRPALSGRSGIKRLLHRLELFAATPRCRCCGLDATSVRARGSASSAPSRRNCLHPVQGWRNACISTRSASPCSKLDCSAPMNSAAGVSHHPTRTPRTHGSFDRRPLYFAHTGRACDA